eukprot:COSAG06_NODE_5839_length_3249_cov_16.365079_5_plen_94_part_00
MADWWPRGPRRQVNSLPSLLLRRGRLRSTRRTYGTARADVADTKVDTISGSQRRARALGAGGGGRVAGGGGSAGGDAPDGRMPIVLVRRSVLA